MALGPEGERGGGGKREEGRGERRGFIGRSKKVEAEEGKTEG